MEASRQVLFGLQQHFRSVSVEEHELGVLANHHVCGRPH